MSKRGGRRPGAGRPKGSKSRFGKPPSVNLPVPELPEKVLAQLPILETKLERQSWKAINARHVAESMEAKLNDLEAEARRVGDLRLVYQLCELRLRYAIGTARPEPEPTPFRLSELIRKLSDEPIDVPAPPPRAALPPAPSETASEPFSRRAEEANARAKARAADEGDRGSTGDSAAADAEIQAALAEWDAEHERKRQ